MGLGTVKWTLGTTRMKIAYLAALYLFFSFLLQVIKEIESLGKRKFEEWVAFLVLLPAAALDTGFYYWIILSLIRTTQQLSLRKQNLKLQLFKLFFCSSNIIWNNRLNYDIIPRVFTMEF